MLETIMTWSERRKLSRNCGARSWKGADARPGPPHDELCNKLAKDSGKPPVVTLLNLPLEGSTVRVMWGT